MNIDRQAVWCVHYWHCVFIRCVGGYSLYVILQLLGLFIIARGLGWVFWGLGGGVQVGGGGRWNVPGVLKRQKNIFFGGGGGGGRKNSEFFFPTKFFFSKMFLGFWNACKQKFIFRGGGWGGFWGVWGHPGDARVGKQYTSSYDHDMWPVKILERSGLAVKSYHPETLAAEEEKKEKKKEKKKFWQTHKAFPAGSRECLITAL